MLIMSSSLRAFIVVRTFFLLLPFHFFSFFSLLCENLGCSSVISVRMVSNFFFISIVVNFSLKVILFSFKNNSCLFLKN